MATSVVKDEATNYEYRVLRNRSYVDPNNRFQNLVNGVLDYVHQQNLGDIKIFGPAQDLMQFNCFGHRMHDVPVVSLVDWYRNPVWMDTTHWAANNGSAGMSDLETDRVEDLFLRLWPSNATFPSRHLASA